MMLWDLRTEFGHTGTSRTSEMFRPSETAWSGVGICEQPLSHGKFSGTANHPITKMILRVQVEHLSGITMRESEPCAHLLTLGFHQAVDQGKHCMINRKTYKRIDPALPPSLLRPINQLQGHHWRKEKESVYTSEGNWNQALQNKKNMFSMERCLRTALWIVCLIGQLEAKPVCSEGNPGEHLHIYVNDLGFGFLTKDVSCVSCSTIKSRERHCVWLTDTRDSLCLSNKIRGSVVTKCPNWIFISLQGHNVTFISPTNVQVRDRERCSLTS